MGVSSGPNINEKGLVFYFDSDNLKSYPGEPTTNLNPDPHHLTRTNGQTITVSAWGGDTGYGEFLYDTSGFTNKTYMMYINHNTSDPAGSGGTYNDFPATRFALENGKTYSRSWYMKSDINQTISGHICSCNRDSDNYYIVGSNINVTTEWQRYLHTFTVSTNTSTDWKFRHINYHTSKIYIAGVQLEEKSHATPFVSGSRSNTSPKDLSGFNHTINLVNADYDSNADIVYNGTEGITVTNSTNLEITDKITMEAVIYHTNRTPGGTATDLSGIIIKPSGYYLCVNPSGYLTFGFYLSSNSQFGGHTASNSLIPLNTWTHVAGTFDGSYRRWYINGKLDKELSLTDGILPRSNNLGIGFESDGYGRKFKGYIPIAKVYNRALTTEEININFNQIRKRFGI